MMNRFLQILWVAGLVNLIAFSVPSSYASSPQGSLDLLSTSFSSNAPHPIDVIGISRTRIPEVPNDDERYHAVSAGNTAVCAIRMDRRLRCWGMNDLGQASPPEGRFKVVSMGDVHGCGITVDDALLCWGGRLGRPQVGDIQGKFVSVLAADDMTCALRPDHTLICWGANPVIQNLPKGRFNKGDASGERACAIGLQGQLLCFGGATLGHYPQPEGRFKAVAMGMAHACAIRGESSQLVCWGNDLNLVTTAPKGAFQQIVAGDFHTCALNTQGKAVCWGLGKDGQTQLPDGLYKSLAAGGAYSCGLLKNGHLRCTGSFANNPFLLQTQNPTTASGVAGENQNPKLLPFSFLSSIFTLFGTGLVNYGKGVDQAWDKQESKNIRWQLGLLSLAAIFTGFGSFITQPDPVKEMLKSIINTLEQLTQAMKRVEQQLAEVKLLMAQTNCNVTLVNLEQYKNQVETQRLAYMKLLNASKGVVTDYTQGATQFDPQIDVDIKSFIENGKTFTLLRGAMSGIHNALLGSTLQSPLSACMNADYLSWKGSATHPFDDRSFYKTSYYQLYTAQAAMGYGLMMLEDINAYQAQQTLVNGGGSSFQAEQLAGFCAVIRSKSKDSDPRWRRAQVYCDDNTELVQSTYKDLVSEIERAGAPYSDDHLVMSMGSDLFYGKAKTNWLWMRDIGGQPITLVKGHAGDWMMRMNLGGGFIDRGDANLYFEGDESKVATWRSDGRAWQELFENYQAYRDVKYPDKSKAPEEDMIELMGSYPDSFADPKTPGTLFKNILQKPFWMSLKTFRMNWDTILYGDEASTDGMGCFVASGINKTDNEGFIMKLNGKSIYYSQRGLGEWVPLTGKICSDRELSRASYSVWGMQAPQHWLSTATDRYLDNSCGGQYPTYFCIGNGWSEGSSKAYAPYVDYLGTFDVRYRDHGGIANRKDWLGVKKEATFWPGQYGYFYRMPVLDVDQRECLTSIANPTVKRQNIMMVDGKPLPTRCGKDLDSVIKSMVPMPEVLPPTDIRIP